jgi:predicted outer membrane repeat protein
MSLATNLKTGIVWLTLCMTWIAAAGDFYVDDSAPGLNNGTNWTDAYRFLRDALDVAKPGDTVKVAQGIYRPNQSSWSPVTGRSDSFVMMNGVTIMGGYKGNSPDASFNPDDRDPNLYPTILSGDLDANDIPIDNPDLEQIADLLTHPTRQDNAYSVVEAVATEPNAVLDGFFIEGGNSNSDEAGLEKDSIHRMGGGLAAINGHATIRKCVFRHNAAAEGGGGAYNRDGNFTLDQCKFIANFGDTSSGYGGGGLVILGGVPVIKRCEFVRNLAGSQATGGAIKNFTGKPQISETLFENNDGSRLGGAISSNGDAVITDCEFINNYASSGGALDFGNSSSNLESKPVVQYSTFINNEGSSRGGAAYLYRSEPQFLGCYFIGNEVVTEGGAAYSSGAEPNFVNCIFNGNMATGVSQSHGGALYLTNNSNASIYNCTFAHNVATVGYSVACKSSGAAYVSHLNIRNSILWNDTFDEVRIMDASTRFIGYTTMTQWDTSGPGNNTSNPMFVDAKGPDGVPGTDDDDLRLRGGNASSSVDSGNNYWIPARGGSGCGQKGSARR